MTDEQKAAKRQYENDAIYLERWYAMGCVAR